MNEPSYDDALPAPRDYDEGRPMATRDRQYMHGPAWTEEPTPSNPADSIERAIAEIHQYAPPPKMLPLPDYVEPREGVPRVGALTAEALVKDFESTARSIQDMADELKASATQSFSELVSLTDAYKAMEAEIKSIVDHVKETAAMYRDEAKLVFVRIEDTTLRMKEVRDMSEVMRERLVATKAGLDSPLPPVTLNQEPGEGQT